MPPKDKYTDPELRDQVKQEIQDSDKGGAPGQWSARKAQFMAQEYKKRGGSYNTDKESGQDDSQKNLSKWTEEEWQTKEGSGHAQQSDGTQKRYLPKKAWEQMSESEKKETDSKKQAESKEGKQFVGNTDKAKDARENANEEEHEHFEGKKQQRSAKKGKGGKSGKAEMAEGVKTRGTGGRQTAGKQEDDEEEEIAEKQDGDDAGVVHDEDAEEDEEFVDDDEEDAEDDEDEEAVPDDEDEEVTADGEDEKSARGQKRGRGSGKSQGGANKKQKTSQNGAQKAGKMGSKHDNPDIPAPAGSSTRLPKVGQRVSWRSLPGWVHGKVVEVVTEEKDVGDQHIKGSKSSPRLALEADSGKMCQHKPDTTYFEDE